MFQLYALRLTECSGFAEEARGEERASGLGAAGGT